MLFIYIAEIYDLSEDIKKHPLLPIQFISPLLYI